MADRRVRYILEVDYDGESATLKAADDLRDVDAAATQAGEGLERARFGFSEIQASIVTAQSACLVPGLNPLGAITSNGVELGLDTL